MKNQPINKSIFKEYDIRGRYPEELNEAAAYAVGRVFVKMKKVKKLALGYDARPESAKVAKSFVLGAGSAGAEIFDLGVCATPQLFFAVGDKHYDGGAMATASHNPAGYTGFKLCGKDGVPMGMKTGLRELSLLAQKQDTRLRQGFGGLSASSEIRRST